eukprot:gene1036-1599_t
MGGGASKEGAPAKKGSSKGELLKAGPKPGGKPQRKSREKPAEKPTPPAAREYAYLKSDPPRAGGASEDANSKSYTPEEASLVSETDAPPEPHGAGSTKTPPAARKQTPPSPPPQNHLPACVPATTITTTATTTPVVTPTAAAIPAAPEAAKSPNNPAQQDPVAGSPAKANSFELEPKPRSPPRRRSSAGRPALGLRSHPSPGSHPNSRRGMYGSSGQGTLLTNPTGPDDCDAAKGSRPSSSTSEPPATAEERRLIDGIHGLAALFATSGPDTVNSSAVESAFRVLSDTLPPRLRDLVEISSARPSATSRNSIKELCIASGKGLKSFSLPSVGSIGGGAPGSGVRKKPAKQRQIGIIQASATSSSPQPQMQSFESDSDSLHETSSIEQDSIDSQSTGPLTKQSFTGARRQSDGLHSYIGSSGGHSTASNLSQVLSDIAHGRSRGIAAASTPNKQPSINGLGSLPSGKQLKVLMSPVQPCNELEELLLSAAEVAHNSTSDVALLCRTIAREVTLLLKAQSCTIWLLDGNNLTTTVSSETGTGSTQPSPGDPDVTHAIALDDLGHNSPEREVLNTKLPVHFREDLLTRPATETENHDIREVLFHPIKHRGDVLGICKCVNKSRDVDIDFTDDDINLLSSLLVFVGVSIRNCLLCDSLKTSEQATRILNQQLNSILDTVVCLQSVDLCDMKLISGTIMKNAQKLVRCQHSELFMVNRETWSLDTLENAPKSAPIGCTVAGMAVSEKRMVHLKDAGKNPMARRDVFLKNLATPARTTLSFPFKNLEGEVMAVSQLVNKYGEDGEILPFTDQDIQAMELFTSFAGMCIRTASLIEFMRKAGNAHSKLMKMMHTPMSRGKSTVSLLAGNAFQVLKASIVLTDAEKAAVFTAGFPIHEYNIRQPKHDRLVSLIVHIFERYNIPSEFNVPTEVLYRFFLTVQKKYRKVPYHNFTHAFDVMQALVTFFESFSFEKYVTRLDRFVLLITALCHDIDHMGLNNSFQLKAETPLGVLS